MQLIADRFADDEKGRTVDLATGAEVSLVVTSAGGAGEQARWAERCAWFASVVHPSLAGLVDYGALGGTMRFEAWDAVPCGAAAAATSAVTARAQRFLQAQGRTAGEHGDLRVARRHGQPVAIPGGSSGLSDPGPDPGPDPGSARSLGADLLALHRPLHRPLQALADMFAASLSGRVAAVAVRAETVGDGDRAVGTLARAARLAGYVPMHTVPFQSPLRSLAVGRAMVLIVSGDAVEGWRCLLEAALDGQRHIGVFVGPTPLRRVYTVAAGAPLSIDALVASVIPECAGRQHMRRMVSAAGRARGSWARFEQLFFRSSRCGMQHLHPNVVSYRHAESRPARAAETTAEYAAAGLPATATPSAAPLLLASPAPPRPCSPSGEHRRLAHALATARAWLHSGRCQPGERLARQVMHRFARRGAWAEAADAALVLAQALARRGRIDAARAVLDDGRPWVVRAASLVLSQRLGLLQAHVLLEREQAAASESLLETVLASAVSLGSRNTIDAGLALARCLYWQGRYDDAWHRLALLGAEAEDLPHHGVRVATARSRVAMGRGLIADALALAAGARDAARRLGDPALEAPALYASALALLGAGDAVQADAAVVEAAAAARRAHDPVLALLIRLLRADIALRQGHRGAAVLLVRRLARLPSAALPGTVALRVELLRSALAPGDSRATAERRAAATGLGALPLFVPAPPAPPAWSPSADEVLEVMRCGQTADDERVVLAALSARLRHGLQASGVGFLGIDHAQPVWAAGEGSRPDAGFVSRILSAGQLLPPCAGERVEAGLPVRYAGRVIGVLAAVWTPAATARPRDDVPLLLSIGATTAGPALSAWLSRRAADALSRTSELIGVSGAMGDVRRAVEQAARAPFPVLVEGESGCGKELVARLLHRLSARRDRPFCSLNGAALPEDLVESELFGHARGAFTGAAGERRGVFEEAHTGTLFLDEVGELSARAQAKLLRAIQEGEIRRVGENVCRRVDVRLVTATNRNLRSDAQGGRFRADLLYRLDVIRIVLPPLRERPDDIPVLAEHYWRDATTRLGSRAVLSAAALAALARYGWPGNVRELQNVLAALAVRCARRGVVPVSALPPIFNVAATPASLRLDAARRQFERSFVCAALVRAGGRRSVAAGELGVTRQGLAKLMARLEVEEP